MPDGVNNNRLADFTTVLCVNSASYLVGLVAAGRYVQSKSFKRDSTLYRVILGLLSMAGTLQAALVFVYFHHLVKEESRGESLPIPIEISLTAPASCLTSYLLKPVTAIFTAFFFGTTHIYIAFFFWRCGASVKGICRGP
ncbi:hypothetical protein FA13DRAFT_1803130 [Coprinellus micaceus]|uniref:Uncharacterized protein n=1 Tax=Coprinellus micaceus TaxID=71717 RepID=A0A4Y7SAS8_COPMI|nr:hypothetical protein FA13DRAFT_1803130 [Coprinellus micaceus]